MKFRWSVKLADQSVQCGVVNTFEEAIQAIRDWFGRGDGAAQGDLMYSIEPIN
jgi:hypothetical protein